MHGTQHAVGCWDGGIVQISTDGDLTWTQLPGAVLSPAAVAVTVDYRTANGTATE